MRQPLVTIASYRSSAEAGRAQAELEAEGIPAFLEDETSEAGSGQVALRVSTQDAERALQVIGNPFQQVPTPEPPGHGESLEGIRCLVCGSAHIETQSASLLLRIAAFAMGQVVPLPETARAQRKFRCGVCGYRWREGQDADGKIPTIG